MLKKLDAKEETEAHTVNEMRQRVSDLKYIITSEQEKITQFKSKKESVKKIAHSETAELERYCREAADYEKELKRDLKTMKRADQIRKATVQYQEKRLRKVMGYDQNADSRRKLAERQ